MGKGSGETRKQVTHVPLLVHLPGNRYAGKRVSGFAQTADALPIVLGRLNLKAPACVTDEDFGPDIADEKTKKRGFVVSSYGYIASVRTAEWNYSAVWDKTKYQGNYKPQLYDLKNDPDELKSVADQHPNVLKVHQAKLDQYLNEGRDITNATFSAEVA